MLPDCWAGFVTRIHISQKTHWVPHNTVHWVPHNIYSLLGASSYCAIIGCHITLYSSLGALQCCNPWYFIILYSPPGTSEYCTVPHNTAHWDSDNNVQFIRCIRLDASYGYNITGFPIILYRSLHTPLYCTDHWGAPLYCVQFIGCLIILYSSLGGL